jgi:hypothetical protein
MQPFQHPKVDGFGGHCPDWTKNNRGYQKSFGGIKSHFKVCKNLFGYTNQSE